MKFHLNNISKEKTKAEFSYLLSKTLKGLNFDYELINFPNDDVEHQYCVIIYDSNMNIVKTLYAKTEVSALISADVWAYMLKEDVDSG